MKTGLPLSAFLLLASMTGCGTPVDNTGSDKKTAPQATHKNNTPLEVSYLVSETPPSMVPVKARLTAGIELLGYAVDNKKPLAPGGGFVVKWFWRIDQPIEEEWSFFTHLLNGKGELVASQNDRGALRSRYSPHTWPAKRIVVDAEPISVPSSWNSPVMEIRTGLWHGNERMSVKSGPVDEEDRVRGPSLEVQIRPIPVRDDIATEVSVDVPFTSRPPLLDGRFEEEDVWARAVVLAAFSDPVTGNLSARATEVRLLYDARQLYVAVKAPDSGIRTSPASNESDITTADAFEILLRPDPDASRYLDILVNPAGSMSDASYASWRDADWSFKSGTRVKTAVDGNLNDDLSKDSAWSAEIAIPISLLGAKPAELDSFSFTANFFQIDRDTSGDVFSAWSPPLRGDFHTLERFGRIRFSSPADSR